MCVNTNEDCAVSALTLLTGAPAATDVVITVDGQKYKVTRDVQSQPLIEFTVVPGTN